jgi:DNA-binding beta-propeller fold protein YncE
VSRPLRRVAALAVMFTLAFAGTASASHGPRFDDAQTSRVLFATTDQNTLIRFNAAQPERLRDIRAITGLPAGVTLAGIDFRPATGDLYGVGTDSVVYRVNPRTGIAVAEGPGFTPGLNGRFFGGDFNPTVDKIRVVSDAAQNLRLNVDEGTLLSSDPALNPGMPRVVDAGYTNSTFSAIKPAATTLYVIDSASDRISIQNPPNNGTLTMTKRLGFDVQDQSGFDIAGANNVGYLATRMNRGSGLYTVDPATGRSRFSGRIGGGQRLVVTGLAAWQD